MSAHLRSSAAGRIIDIKPNKKCGVDVILNGHIVANFLEEDIYDFALDVIEQCVRKEKDLLGSGLRRRQLEVQFSRSASHVIITQHLV